jgi:hypothetical protein
MLAGRTRTPTKNEPCREALSTLVDKNFLVHSPEDSSFTPTLEGEAFHGEIIDVYVQGRIGTRTPPPVPSGGDRRGTIPACPPARHDPRDVLPGG